MSRRQKFKSVKDKNIGQKMPLKIANIIENENLTHFRNKTSKSNIK